MASLGVLETPSRLHGRQTGSDDAHTRNDPTHPNVRTQPRHDQIRRHVEDDIADIEQRQTSRNLLRRQVKLGCEIMALVDIHRLCKSHIRSDGRAEEVQDPKCYIQSVAIGWSQARKFRRTWQDSPIELAIGTVSWKSHEMYVVQGQHRPIHALDAINVHHVRPLLDIIGKIIVFGPAPRRLCNLLFHRQRPLSSGGRSRSRSPSRSHVARTRTQRSTRTKHQHGTREKERKIKELSRSDNGQGGPRQPRPAEWVSSHDESNPTNNRPQPRSKKKGITDFKSPRAVGGVAASCFSGHDRCMRGVRGRLEQMMCFAAAVSGWRRAGEAK